MLLARETSGVCDYDAGCDKCCRSKLWQKNKWEPGMTDNSDRDVNGEQRHNYVFVHLICQILKSCSVSLLIPHSVVIIVVL